jgi:TetR/AcrR family transcriptional regulator, cholesterol catabolism regulator
MARVMAALSPDAGPLDRVDAAVEAHLRYSLEISDYTTASIRNAGLRCQVMGEQHNGGPVPARAPPRYAKRIP